MLLKILLSEKIQTMFSILIKGNTCLRARNQFHMINSLVTLEGINSSMDGDSSQVCERLSYSRRLPSRGHGKFMLVQNNVHETGFSSSVFGSSSVVSDSPIDFQFLRNSTIYERLPSDLGFLVSEREQNRQDESLLHVEIVSTSSNMPSRSSEISSQEARRNSRRLFWDAFSRRNSSGDFFRDELEGDFRSSRNMTRGGNEQQWHSRSEVFQLKNLVLVLVLVFL